MIKRNNEKLWKSIVKEVKRDSKGGKRNEWSARKAQLAVYLYKKRGGTYRGKKSQNNSLVKWTKQKWRTKSGKNSIVGKNATHERYLPEKAIQQLSSKDYKRTSLLKKKSNKQYSRQPDDIIKVVRKYII